MKRILIDADKCDGCKNCSIACMNAHRTDGGDSVYTLDLNDPANESRNFIRLDGEGHYKPIFCRHCDVPMCAGSCMSGALQKDLKTGLVTYDGDRCGSCYMCVMNCPYGVPIISITQALTFTVNLILHLSYCLSYYLQDVPGYTAGHCPCFMI